MAATRRAWLRIAVLWVLGAAAGAEGRGVELSVAAKELAQAGARFSPDYMQNYMAFLTLDEKFAASPEVVARLGELDATIGVEFIGDKAADAGLGEVPKMGSVKSVKLRGVSLTPGQVAKIAALKLRGVQINGTKEKELGEVAIRNADGIEQLAFEDFAAASVTVEAMAKLEDLGVARHRLKETPLRVALGKLPELKKLALSQVDAGGVRLREFPKLEEVTLNGAMSDEMLRELATLQHLRKVSLNGMKNGDVALAALAGSRLESLYVQRGATDAGLRKIADFSHLTVFAVLGEGVSNDSLERLKSATKLTAISLDGARVDDALFKTFPVLKELVTVSLRKTGVGDASAGYFAGLPNLYSLDLQNTKLTDAGLKLLAASGSLRELDVRGTAVTAAGVAALEKALPRVRVVSDVNDWLKRGR